MDIRQMRYLVAVAEELNFTRAAQRCNVSQPPLSRAIRNLEDEIGVQLFLRDTHSVSLTLAGEALVADVRQALSQTENAIEHAQRIAAGMRGTLRMGFGGSTVYALLPTLIRKFRENAPDVKIEFCAMPVLGQIDALRSGEIDLGILRLPIFDEMLETYHVHTEPLMVALGDGHELLKQDGPINMARLQGNAFATYEPTRGFNFHSDLLALCRVAGFDPDIVHQAPTTEAVIGIVACGEGVAIVPASASRLRMSGVVFRSIDADSVPTDLLNVKFGIAWCKETATATALKFKSIAREAGIGVQSWAY